MLITPAQLRAGRALLGWTREQLASASGVSGKTIQHMESDDRKFEPRISSQKVLIMAFEQNGIELIPGGVRFASDGDEPGEGDELQKHFATVRVRGAGRWT